MDARLANALVSAQKYYYEPGSCQLAADLEKTLQALSAAKDEWTLCVSCQTELESSAVLLRLLLQLRSILQAPECVPSVLSAVFCYLTELAWFNPIVRQHMQRQLQYDIVLCLNALHVKRANLDEQVWLDCLKLLQLFTYDCHLRWTPVAMDLVKLMVQQVCSCCNDAKAQSLPYCLGILLNYIRRVPDSIQYIKVQDNIQTFNRTLLLVLKEATASLVILSTYFVILAFQDIQEANFSGGTTIIKTIKCIANVIGRGQCFMARFYAVDLFVHFINEASVRRHLLASGRFVLLLTELCTLFDTLSASLEHVAKIYEMFLQSCQVDGIRQAFCSALLAAGPTDNQRLTSPLLAVVQMARRSPESLGGFCGMPVRAYRVLYLVFGHVVSANDRLADYLAPDSLIQMLEECLKITLDTGSPLAREKSEIVFEALRLAALVSRDASIQADVVETVDTVLCAHLAHFQLLSNPVGSLTTGGGGDLERQPPPPEWSMIGVHILLTVVQFLSDQSGHSTTHGLLFDEMIGDERLVPFIAVALASGDVDMTHSALRLINAAAAKCRDFASRLAALVSRESRRNRVARSVSSRLVEEVSMDVGDATVFGDSRSRSAKTSGSVDLTTDTADVGGRWCLDDKRLSDLDAVLNKLRSTQIVDKSVSGIVEIYEAKITASQLQIEHLKEQLRLRIEAVQKSDHLFAKFLMKNQTAKREEEHLREVLLQAANERHELTRQLDESNAIIAAQTKKLTTLEAALDSSRREVECEKELHATLREHYNRMKANFEAVSKKLLHYEQDARRRRSLVNEKHLVDGEGD